MKKMRKFLAMMLSFILAVAIFPATVFASPNPSLPEFAIEQEYVTTIGGDHIFRMVISARAPGGFDAFDMVMSFSNALIIPVDNNNPHADVTLPPISTTTWHTSDSIVSLSAAELDFYDQFWLAVGGRTGFHFSAMAFLGTGVPGSLTVGDTTEIFAFYFRVDNNDLDALNPNSIRVESGEHADTMLTDNVLATDRFPHAGITLTDPSFSDSYVWGPYDSGTLPPGATLIPDTNKVPENIGGRSVAVGTQGAALTAGSTSNTTFTVNTINIPEGTHAITVTGLPGTVTVQSPGTLVINASGAGTLTLVGAAAMAVGSHTLTLSFDDFDVATWNDVDGNLNPPSPVVSNQFTLTIGGAGTTAAVGTQVGILTAGTPGTVTFPVTTSGIANGTYAVIVANLPAGVTVQGQVIISANSGTLTLAGSAATIAGTTSNLTLTIGGATSSAFALTIIAPTPPPPPVQLDTPTDLDITYPDFSWSAVDNSIGYYIYVNGQPHVQVVGQASVDVLALSGLGVGTHSIQVRALGDGVNFLDSELSEAINFVVGPTPTPTPTPQPPVTGNVQQPGVTGVATIVRRLHTITIMEGGIGSGVTGGVSHASGTVVTINAGTRAGYVFNGWTFDQSIRFTLDSNASQATTRIIMPSRDVIATANWTPTVTQPTQQQPTQQPSLPQLLTMTPAGQLFDDVAANAWYHDYVTAAVHNNLFQGTAPRTFSPGANMTRAMFVQVLANLEGVDLAVYADTTPSFNDVSSSAWYFAAVEWASSLGVVQGIGEGSFAPNASVTREQIALMLYRYVQITGVTLPQETTAFTDTELHYTTTIFTDQQTISPWASEAVAAIQAAGIITGRPDGRFDPQATATRAEVGAVFVRLVEVMQ